MIMNVVAEKPATNDNKPINITKPSRINVKAPIFSSNFSFIINICCGWFINVLKIEFWVVMKIGCYDN